LVTQLFANLQHFVQNGIQSRTLCLLFKSLPLIKRKLVVYTQL